MVNTSQKNSELLSRENLVALKIPEFLTWKNLHH